MKFTLTDENAVTMMSHIMLSSKSLAINVSASEIWSKCGELEATLQINGVEVPAKVLEDFLVDLWERAKSNAKERYDENNFDQRVEDKAKQLLKEHADNALEQLSNLTIKLEEVENVLTPSWERK